MTRHREAGRIRVHWTNCRRGTGSGVRFENYSNGTVRRTLQIAPLELASARIAKMISKEIVPDILLQAEFNQILVCLRDQHGLKQAG